MKKLLPTLLALLLVCLALPCASAADVTPSPQKLSVDGTDADCDKYNIDGSNYFKLRDLAYLLSKSDSRFSVAFDAESNAVTVVPGGDYVPVGGELERGKDLSKTAVASKQSVLINGEAVEGISVYNIGGNNYFKLRDLGSALGEEKATEITVRSSVTELSALLENIDAVDGYEIDPTDEEGVLNARLTTEDEGALREQLFSALAGAGMTVYRIQPVTRTLEEMFLRLTQENDAAAVDEDMPDDESLAGADDNGNSTADTYGDGDETDGETDSGTDADSGAADVDTDKSSVDGADAAGDADGDDGYKPLFG